MLVGTASWQLAATIGCGWAALWYGGDFRQVAGSVPTFAARYSPDLKRALDTGSDPKIEWLPYDWALNSKENAR